MWGELVGSLWLLPALFVAVALFAGWALSHVEIADDSALAGAVFRGSAEDARQLLIVVSGTMITVTGLVFVLTIVALQIASTQFSPRLLRAFLQDRGTQLVLATFVATFAYSLAGLHTVGRVTDAGDQFVPRLAVSGSLALALASVGMLVYYIQHITNSIRIDTIMRKVAQKTVAGLRRAHPSPLRDPEPAPPDPPPDALAVPVDHSGYVQGLEAAALVAVAREAGVVVRLAHPVGHHLVTGNTLGWVWFADDGRPPDGDRWFSVLNDAVLVEHERSDDRDYAFGLRQLVDIAMRAIAPSVNDPYTAVQAIQQISVVMSDMAGRDLAPVVYADELGAGRVAMPVTTFEENLAMVCSSIRTHAAGRSRVAVALLRMLENVAERAPSVARRAAVAQQVRLIGDAARSSIGEEVDLAPVLEMAAAAQDACRDRAPATSR